jgi:exodeoxyribonuclease VII small subunit
MTSDEIANLSFEEAFARLEAILEQMNTASIPLEEALALYEQSAQLISLCNRLLNSAEQKIEILLKQRDGQLALDEQQRPKTAPFAPQTR